MEPSETSELTIAEFDELWKIANAHYEDENWQAAMEVFEQTLARAPSLTPTPDELTEWKGLFLARLLYGHLLEDSERFSEAIPVAREAALHPDFHRSAQNMVGYCYAGLGEHKAAVKAFFQALEKDPLEDTIPWVGLSIALDMCGFHEESDFCLYTILQIDPEHEDAHFNLGVSAWHRGNLEEAECRFRSALAGLPDYGGAHAELGRLLLEQTNGDGEKMAEAEQHLRRAVELEPEEVRPRLYMAQLYWARDKLEDADRQFRAALDIRPDWTTTHYLYGHFLECAVEDIGLAAQYYLKALELDSLNLPALFSVVHFLKRQGRHGGANKFRRRVRNIAEDMTRACLGPFETEA